VSDVSKQILIKNIKQELDEDIHKIAGFWCLRFLFNSDDKMYYYEELRQIADETLSRALDCYDEDRAAGFKTFYITCLKNSFIDFVKDKNKNIDLDFLPKSNLIFDEYQNTTDEADSVDNNIDKKFLHDKLLLYIDKINFNMPIQKEIFLEVSGIKKNFEWKSLEEYGEIIGYTKQNISKTYKRYFNIFLNMIQNDEKAREEFRQFL
jgi:RNA polymerase sigma factor (sigma-70 family)